MRRAAVKAGAAKVGDEFVPMRARQVTAFAHSPRVPEVRDKSASPPRAARIVATDITQEGVTSGLALAAEAPRVH